jgi:hypothetical protein
MKPFIIIAGNGSFFYYFDKMQKETLYALFLMAKKMYEQIVYKQFYFLLHQSLSINLVSKKNRDFLLLAANKLCFHEFLEDQQHIKLKC